MAQRKRQTNEYAASMLQYPSSKKGENHIDDLEDWSNLNRMKFNSVMWKIMCVYTWIKSKLGAHQLQVAEDE